MLFAFVGADVDCACVDDFLRNTENTVCVMVSGAMLEPMIYTLKRAIINNMKHMSDILYFAVSLNVLWSYFSVRNGCSFIASF